MYITEMIDALRLLKAQYGDIRVIVNDQQSFRINLRVVDQVDPKTLLPVAKVVVAE